MLAGSGRGERVGGMVNVRSLYPYFCISSALLSCIIA